MKFAAVFALAYTVSAAGLLAADTASDDVIGKLLSPGNLAASSLLAFFVIAFIKGWIVPAWVYKVEKDRADRMEERAWKATEALARSVETVAHTSEAVLAQRQQKAP